MRKVLKDTSFDQCIKCNICTVYCPVAKVDPEFLGPKFCGPDSERMRMKSPDFFDESLKLCINCKKCETACPSGVKIGDIIAVARSDFEKPKFDLKYIRNFILSHSDMMGHISTPVAPIVNIATKSPLVKKIMDKTIGVHERKDLPEYSHKTFRNWYKKNLKDQDAFPRQVNYFHGCYVNYNNPQLGKDFVKIMNAMHIGVQLIRNEKCCGVPLIANGFFKKATKNAISNVKNFEKAIGKNNIPIISSSSTCALTLQDEYPNVLKIDNSHVVQNIKYVTSFLLNEFMAGNVPKMKPLNLTVVYHTPCHLERSGASIFTIELLKMIPGVKLIVLKSECCGMAGTFGFKSENYEKSIKIGSSLFKNINSHEADFAITDCETCKWQIDENTKLKTLHPMTLLAMAIS